MRFVRFLSLLAVALSFAGAAHAEAKQDFDLSNKTGYEIQIWGYQPAGYNTGSLVDSLKAAPTKILEGQWNDYDIKAEGNHYVIILNGKTILDDHDSKHTEGVIGFQCQPANKIEFRNVKLLPLTK